MEKTFIIEKKKPRKLRRGVLLTGLPGIGLIGQVVGRYLVEELKAEKVATLISPYFPHQVFMTKKGGIRLIRNSFYVHRGRKHDLVILVGDIQAMSSVGQYEVAGAVLDYCQKLGVREIITVGGYSTGKIADARRIFAVCTSDALRSRLRKYGIIFGEARGSIVGAAGLLPALGRLRAMDGSCVMGETHGGYVDTSSARQIVMFLSKYLDMHIDVKKLDAQAKESEKLMKKVEDDIKRNIESQVVSGQKVSYIR